MAEKKPLRIALYARVSKADDQTTENQLIQLKKWAQDAGVEATIFEESVSSRDTRPMKEEILNRLRLGTRDGVAFVSLSRWGRSLDELAREIREFHESKWDMISLKEGFRLDTASGRAMAGMLATFSEFERELIRERTIAGLARVKAQGGVLGPPKGNQNARKHPKQTPPVNPVLPSPLAIQTNQSDVRSTVPMPERDTSPNPVGEAKP